MTEGNHIIRGLLSTDAVRLTHRILPEYATGFTKCLASLEFANWYMYEFFCFVYVQQEVEKHAKTFIELPPIQKGASFNLEAVTKQILKAIKSRSGD